MSKPVVPHGGVLVDRFVATAQVETFTVHFFSGRFTRRPVSWDASATVSASDGKIDSGAGAASAIRPPAIPPTTATTATTNSATRRRIPQAPSVDGAASLGPDGV